MANRYWVGNGGNINDTAHWSTTSGGAGGASVPTSADAAIFDALSFTLAGQTVTINVTFSCLNMDWTGSTNSPTLAGSTSLSVYGNFTLIAAMTFSSTGTTTFTMNSALTNLITTAGKTIGGQVSFNDNAMGGAFTLQDDFTGSSAAANSFDIVNGTFNSNGKTINVVNFSSNYTTVRTINLTSSSINASGNITIGITSLTLTKTGSTITMSGNSKTFAGGGGAYNNVTFTGTPITITGSNTFNTLNIAAGKTLKLTSGTTQTTTTFLSNGTTANPSTLQAVTAASPATIALPAGRYFIRHTSVKDITISGATSMTDIAGTDATGNTGITFVTKFEMGRIKNDGSFNWYNTTTGTVTKVSG